MFSFDEIHEAHRVMEANAAIGKEIAELMAFLVSPAAKWMTGSTLRIDE